jgi:quinol monooxygenase YgiN
MSNPAKPQLTLFVDFFIQPHLIDQWKQGHRPVWAACAHEPNCLLFDVFSDPDDPGHFTLVEVWSATKQWFLEVQMQKEYYAELWRKTEHTYRAPRIVRFAERLGEGASYRRGYLKGARCMD